MNKYIIIIELVKVFIRKNKYRNTNRHYELKKKCGTKIQKLSKYRQGKAR